MVYRDVSIHAEGATDALRPDPVYTVSVDEKPGVQALGLTAPDLPPVPGKARAFGRDYEYVRHGTVSILAGIDLHSGHIFANVEDRHRSVEFIGLLKRLDDYYPPDAIIRLVLDNHSAHSSKETNAYLATRPRRFEYVHTPKHGSWLNLIECAFREDGQDLPAPHPGGLHRRAEGPNLEGRRRVQRGARRVPLEQVRPRTGLMCKYWFGTSY